MDSSQKIRITALPKTNPPHKPALHDLKFAAAPAEVNRQDAA
jgi:hypothetical protein